MTELAAWHRDGREHVPLRAAGMNNSTLSSIHPPSMFTSNEGKKITTAHKDSIHNSLFSSHTKSSAKKLSPTKSKRSSTRAVAAAVNESLVGAPQQQIRTPAADTSSQVKRHALANGELQVDIAFRVIKDGDSFLYDEVDKVLIQKTRTESIAYAADFLFPPSASFVMVGDAVLPGVMARAMKGVPSVLVAHGSAGSGKTETLFGPDGLFRGYINQLLFELDRNVLSSVYCVRCMVLDVIGDNVLNVLSPSAIDSISADATGLVEHKAIDDSKQRYHAHKIQSSRGIDDICHRIVDRSKTIARHEVVLVTVSPTNADSALSSLVKPFGTVAFVELGANLGSQKKDPQSMAIFRHGATTLFQVCAALLKRRQLPDRPTHVPFHDDALTVLLQQELDTGHTTIILHLDGTQPVSVQQSTLEVGGRVMSEKFPLGRPVPNYKALAISLQAQLSTVSQQWGTERDRMFREIGAERERNQSLLEKIEQQQAEIVALRKKMNEGMDAEKVEKNLAVQPQSPTMAAFEKRLTEQLQELRSARATIAELQTELTKLKSANVVAEQQSEKEVEVTTLEKLSFLSALVGTLSSHKLVQLPRIEGLKTCKASITQSEAIAWRAAVALTQLTHQLCERERAAERLIQRINIHEVGGNSIPDPTLFLKWKNWRKLLLALRNLKTEERLAIHPLIDTCLAGAAYPVARCGFDTGKIPDASKTFFGVCEQAIDFQQLWVDPAIFPTTNRV